MYRYICWLVVVVEVWSVKPEHGAIDVVDLSRPTTVRVLAEYYGAVDRRWKLCANCGVPGLGTTMRLEHEGASSQAVFPALVPAEYLLTRLVVVDVSALTALQPALALSLDVALQWAALRRAAPHPALLLFRFGWQPPARAPTASCVCKIPGISFELAEWIAANLSHVVGVATDAPTLESEQTREFNTRTVAATLGRAGVYMMENVHARRQLPESGCMAIAMPLKLQHSNYVPARLTAFCPSAEAAGGVAGGAGADGRQVVVAVRGAQGEATPRLFPSRNHDVDLDDILNS